MLDREAMPMSKAGQPDQCSGPSLHPSGRQAPIPPFDRWALVQPRIGIGDMVWHLPHIQALTRQLGGRATLVARSTSCADQLVGPEDGIAEVLWIEQRHRSSLHGTQGAIGMAHLVRELRARRFDAAVLLTRSRTLTLAAAAAGIPKRYGYGLGRLQRSMLSGQRHLPPDARGSHAYDQAGAWLGAAGIPLADAEPRLHVNDTARMTARLRLNLAGIPFVTLGIAASVASKKWGMEGFAELAARLLDNGWPALVLLGGEGERPEAEAILRRLRAADAMRVTLVLGWNLREVAAVLQDAAFYVGNDTGMLNIAAAVGTRSYGLFGATPVLTHSPNIVPVVPPGGPDSSSGMARIDVSAVLDAIADQNVPCQACQAVASGTSASSVP